MPEFISEPIAPAGPVIEAHAMARGEPGLPAAFTWQDRRMGIVRCTARWKQSGHEVGNAHGQIYLRRHYFKLLMEDETTWTVYFVRQTPRSGSPRRRWFLYAVEPEKNVECRIANNELQKGATVSLSALNSLFVIRHSLFSLSSYPHAHRPRRLA